MAPCRQLIMWSVPSIAVLLGIFWFRKKREYAKSDPGGRERIKSLQEELAEALNCEAEALKASPLGKADRSIIKSAPIDIVPDRSIIKSAPIDIVPNGVGSQRSSPMELTDEEMDFEIEKIIRTKSVKNDFKVSSSIDRVLVMQSLKVEPSFKIPVPSSKRGLSLQSEANSIREVTSMCQEDTKHIVATSNANVAEKESAHNVSAAVVDDSPLEGAVVAEEEECNNNIVEEANDTSESEDNEDRFSTAQSRHISERDSANHSPVDPLLASPSMCHFSDNHSEGSSDSGKGCSEAASPPPATINMAPSDTGLRIHQFIIPQTLVGLLIGKHGSFVTLIKGKTGASVYVRRHPDSVKQKICAIEGTQSEIEAALDMIREKFPEKRFPNFTLEEISPELYQKLIPLVPEFLQLVESVNNETIMTCLVSAGHFFLQQPLHPTFPSLHALHRLMAATYSQPDVPPLPSPVKEGSICAAPTENNWYRAQVVSVSAEQDTAVVKLVDFGGYLTLDTDQLKQIRSDFMTLPFQATEAMLAFVKPANNESEWSGEALRIMAGLTAGQLLHAQVAGYDEAHLPLVHLYLTLGPQQVIFLNQELVERGFAEWDVPADS